MKTRFLGLVGAAALAAGLALTSATATAGADAWQHQGNTPAAWQGDHGRSAPTADLSLVHGVPALNVDIYVVKNLFSYKEFKNVQTGTAADVSTDYPGWVTPAFYVVDVVPTGGQARVTVRHLAVAPTVGVYADSTVAITPAFSNGQTATAAVPAGSYHVTVTAPNTPGTVLADLGSVTLPADTNALAFAIGIYPSSFEVVPWQCRLLTEHTFCQQLSELRFNLRLHPALSGWVQSFRGRQSSFLPRSLRASR
jgi:hypothetical protein